jgi:hypothetical protein
VLTYQYFICEPSVSAWRRPRLAIAPDYKLSLAPGERLTLASVRRLMRKNCRDSAVAIETVNLLFPGSIPIFRPLKRQGPDQPLFGVEERRRLQSGSQDFTLLS